MITDTLSTQPGPPSTFAGRIVRGMASIGLTQVLGAAEAILLVPLFLAAWGADGYGRWLSLTALIMYALLLDLGEQNFMGNLLAREFVNGNESEFRERLAEGVSLSAVIDLAALLLLSLLVSLPGLRLPGQATPLDLAGRLVLLLMGAALLLSVTIGIYATAYRATGLLARGAMVNNLSKMVFLACYVLVLLARLPPAVYAAVYLTASITLTLVVVWDTRRRIAACGRVRLSLAAARRGRVHLRGSLFFWLLAVANAVNFQGVIVVLAAAGSPALVALYATHRTASGLIGYIGTLIQAPLWPEMAFLHARDHLKDLVRLTHVAVRAFVYLSGAAALGLWVLLPVIYPLWTGKRLELQPALLAVLLVQAVLAAAWTTTGWIRLASNQHRSLAYWMLANATLTIGLAAAWVGRFGVMGVALATLIGDLVCGAAIYPWLSSRSLGLPAGAMYKSVALALLPLIPATLFVWLAEALFHGWAAIVLGLVPSALLTLLALNMAFGQAYGNGWALRKLRSLRRAGA